MSSNMPALLNVIPQSFDYEQPIIQHLLLNSRRDRPETMYAGTMMTLPSRDEYHPLHCGYDDDGDPIPGSYVVSDIFTDVPQTGERIHTFSATRAVQHILGFKRAKDGKAEATSAYARSGISLLAMRPSKAVWKAISKAGEHRAWLVEVENARYTIAALADRNSRLAKANMTLDPGDEEYNEACRIVTEYNQRMGIKKSAVPSAVLEEENRSELELQVEMKAIAETLATKAAQKHKIDQVEFVKSMLDDPNTRLLLREQAGIIINRRGFMTPTNAQLRDAAIAGKAVSDIPGQDDAKTPTPPRGRVEKMAKAVEEVEDGDGDDEIADGVNEGVDGVDSVGSVDVEAISDEDAALIDPGAGVVPIDDGGGEVAPMSEEELEKAKQMLAKGNKISAAKNTAVPPKIAPIPEKLKNKH